MCFKCEVIYFCIAVIIVCCQGYPEAIGVWPLNANHPLDDISPNDNHATAVSKVQYEDDSGGPVGGSSYMTSSSSDGSILISNAPCLRIQRSFTFAFLLKNRQGSKGYIFGFWEIFATRALRVYYDDRMDFLNPMQNGTNKMFIDHRSFPNNEWVFVAVTYDYASGTETITHDDISYSKTFGQMNIDTNRPMRLVIGGYNTMTASMACLQIYRKALSPGELALARQKAWDGCRPQDFQFVIKPRTSFDHRFYVMDNARLNTDAVTPLNTLYLHHRIACSFSCWQTCGCVAFTFKESNSQCQLFNILDQGNLLQTQTEWQYFYLAAFAD